MYHFHLDYSDEKAMNDINATPVNVLCNIISRCISMKINPSQTFPPISEQCFSQFPQEDQDMFHSLTSKLPGNITFPKNTFNFISWSIERCMPGICTNNYFCEKFQHFFYKLTNLLCVDLVFILIVFFINRSYR